MHRILACFLLALVVPNAPAPPDRPPIDRPIHIVYIAPPGDPWTAEAQADVRAQIAAAHLFWMDLAPLPTRLRIASTRVITLDGDLVDSLEWSRPYWQPLPAITLFVINTQRPLLRDYLAQSQTPLGLIWAVRGDGDGFTATIAHELGHVLYRLPHQYQDLYDIMGLTPVAAYQAGTIGCASRAELGRPCTQIWLPLIAGT